MDSDDPIFWPLLFPLFGPLILLAELISKWKWQADIDRINRRNQF